MKTLHLVLKKKWFDMISSGEKTEEYREIKPYWEKRLLDYKSIESYIRNLAIRKYILNNPIDACKEFPRRFTHVTFHNGYHKNAPSISLEIKGITLGYGKEEWGAPKNPVFIIKLGRRI